MPDVPDLVGKALESKVVEKAYDDGVSPALKELGKIGVDLAKTARLILAPFQFTALFQDKLERLIHRISNRVPEEDQIFVPAILAGPAFESMKYLDEEDVLWMIFEELLTKAADRRAISVVHPAFVQIVKQLTRDEAYLLYKLSQGDFEIVDTFDKDAVSRRWVNYKVEASTIPEKELQSPGSVSIYYAHLESLSLVKWPILHQDPIWGQEDARVQTGIRRTSKMTLTDFGRMFVAACIPDGGIPGI